MSQLASLLQYAGLGNIPGLRDLIDRAQADQDEANEQNEMRYEQALGVTRGIGESSKRDVRRGGAEERAGFEQDAVNRGLASSTVLDAMRNRSREREQREVSRIDDSTRGMLAGLFERRTDEGPDLAGLAGLIGSIASGRAQQQRSHTVVGGAPGGGRA